MRLLKLLRKALKRSEPGELVADLNHYGKSFSLVSRSDDIIKQTNMLKFGEKSIFEVIDLLKLGRLDEVGKHLFKIDKVPNTMKMQLTREMQEMPSFRVGKHAGDVKNMELELKHIFADADLTARSRNDRRPLTMAHVMKNTGLGELLAYMLRKRFYSFTGRIVLVGGSLLAAINVINSHRETISGCIRYTVKNGNVSACKVAECSCIDGRPMTANEFLCDENVSIPAEMKKLDNCQGYHGIGCVKCPIPIDSGEGAQSAASRNFEASTSVEIDKVFYKCNTPTIAETIGDLLNQRIGETIKHVKNANMALGSFFHPILFIIKYALVALILLTVIFWAYRKYRKSNNNITTSSI